MDANQMISRPVIGYEGVYLITVEGVIQKVDDLSFKECLPDKNGFVELVKNGKVIKHSLPVLVMKHFVTNYKTYLPVKQLKTGPDYSVPNLTQNKLFS